MARKLRVEYPGAIYHVMSRGDRREPIFADDQDRERFLETLGEAGAKTGWQVHAYVLIPNHFHLVVETPQANLVAGMKWLLGAYTGRFNRRHKVFGHLFSGRYKALIVDGSGSGYLKSVCDYVHLNPVRAKLIASKEPLRSFAWSSWPTYLGAPGQRPAWLRVDRLLGEWGIPKDSPAGRRRLEAALEERRGAEEGEEFKAIRRGWCLGDEAFRKELLAQMSQRVGAEHYGEERAGTAETKAEQIIAGELARLLWEEAELRTRPGGDARKVALAARLRAETTLTAGWIAERLGIGSRGYLHHLLYRRRKPTQSSQYQEPTPSPVPLLLAPQCDIIKNPFMKFLNFQCTEYFKTSGSASFDLREPVLSADKPAELQGVNVVSCVGNVEIHYPSAGHIKAYVRVVMPGYLAKGINRIDFKNAVESFLEKHGLPCGVTYEADLIPYSLIMRVENRVDVDGMTDGLS